MKQPYREILTEIKYFFNNIVMDRAGWSQDREKLDKDKPINKQ